MSWKTIIKKLIIGLVVAGFFIFVLGFFYKNPARFTQLFSLSYYQVVILTGLSLLVFMGLAKQLALTLEPYNKTLPLLEAFTLAVANNFLNYLPMKSGIVGKGIYLKVTQQLSLKEYLASLTAGQMLWVMMSGVLGFIALILMRFLQGVEFEGTLSAITLLLFATALCCYILFFHTKLLLQLIPFASVKKFFRQCCEAIACWRVDNSLIWRYSLISLALFCVFALKICIAFTVVGADISFFAACFLQSCVAVSFAVSIVPGNLGIREGLLVGLATLLQIDAETALLAALLDRAAILLPTLVLGPVALYRLGRNI